MRKKVCLKLKSFYRALIHSDDIQLYELRNPEERSVAIR